MAYRGADKDFSAAKGKWVKKGGDAHLGRENLATGLDAKGD